VTTHVPTTRVWRALPLAAQLLILMVALIVGTIIALTLDAHRASVASLELQALREVGLAVLAREQALTQRLELRQQRAGGFLISVESICAEPRPAGGFGWAEECTETMLREFTASEGARGATMTYRGRVLDTYGTRTPGGAPEGSGIAWFVTPGAAAPDYALQVARGDAALTLLFEGSEVQRYFDDPTGLGRTGRMFLADGTILPARPECLVGARTVIETNEEGRRTVTGFAPVPALGAACIEARIDYDEVVAPAFELRADLARRGFVFALMGVLVSLALAHLIASPVRKLVDSARALQGGDFGREVPIGGPREVRLLGQAFAGMAAELAAMIEGARAARRQAEAANRSKDQFLAMLSHEMRTPLNAILGWTRLLQSGQLDPDKAARALGVVERSANAQRRLIEDLLDVSRIVAGQLRLQRERVALPAITEAALEALRPLADERRVALAWEIEDPTLSLMGDAQRLQQVVWNLAWNAIKFTPEGGRVDVMLRRDGAWVHLSVSDTGVGISPEFLPHVFEWYRQDESGKGIAEAGLGLGLALVRQLVDLHGGTVHAESRGQGQGATFVVMLPLEQRRRQMEFEGPERRARTPPAVE
jgi:signal transduction histidine kinase